MEQEMDRGVAANVLDGPVHALGHFVRGLAEHRLPIAIRPGDLVHTGR
jgi:2-oxo-3-hexenedioate decarboxylase